MDAFPFWVLVPIVAIIAWAAVQMSSNRARSQELTKRVEDLERRVTALEGRS